MDSLINIAFSPVSIPFGIACTIAACALAIVCLKSAWKAARRATFICSGVFIGIAVFFGVWCAIGRCEANAITFAMCEFVLAGAACLVLQRDWLARHFQNSRVHLGKKRTGAPTRGIPTLALRDAILLLVAALLSLITVECADNANWISLPTVRFIEALLVVLAAMAALYFLTQRRAWGPLLVTVACIVFGCVQFFLTQYKDMALQPSDILAWQTAAGVGAGYTYAIGDTLMWSFVFGALAICTLEFIVPAKRTTKRGWKTVAINLACCAVIGGGLAGVVTNVDFEDVFGKNLNYWDLRYAYRANTFTLGFIAAVQNLQITAPEDYDEDAARALEEELAAEYDAKHTNDDATSSEAGTSSDQASESRPNIVVVMNESYADLSIYEGLHSGYTAPLAARLGGTSLSGTLNVSVFGGGTCNTEYEFLTGSSMSFLGSGMYPYQEFSLEGIPALPQQLQEAGYHTVGIHASYADNWRRNTIYPTLGFQDCYFISDFGASWRAYHHTVADSVTYDKVLETLQDNDEPTFAFNVTIQNHGGYNKGGTPAEDEVQVTPDFETAQSTSTLDEYLSCIKGSDNDLQALLDELEDFDEPTVVVFFGDHQPSMSRSINDAVFSDEDSTSVEHLSRLYETPYFIWANYDLDSDGDDAASASDGAASANGSGTNASTSADTSPNYLAAQLLELVGIPLTNYQKAELVLREKLPTLNAEGYQDADGAWHTADEATSEAAAEEGAAAEAAKAYRELNTLHYLEITSKL